MSQNIYGENSLESRYPFLSIIHPAHIDYIRHSSFNTLNYFFEVLNSLVTEKRAEILRYFFFYSTPKFGYDEQKKSLSVPEVNVESFKAFIDRCRQAATFTSEPVLITGMVTMILTDIFRVGDTTSVEQTKDRLMRMAEIAMKDPQAFRDETAANDAMDWMVNKMEHVPEQIQEGYKLYVYFCENVLQKLLDQPIPS